MKAIDTYISEKLVLNKDNVKDYINDDKFICIFPYGPFFEFLRENYSYNSYIDKEGFQLFVFNKNQINDIVEEFIKTKSSYDKTDLIKISFLYEIPSKKYGDNLNDIINNLTNTSNFSYNKIFKTIDIREFF